jgi:hypothetical protein
LKIDQELFSADIFFFGAALKKIYFCLLLRASTLQDSQIRVGKNPGSNEKN